MPVVLAAGPIEYGAKLQAKDLVLTQLPANAVPPGAYASVDQVMKADAGGAPVALASMSAREPVLPAKISGPGTRPTLAAMIGQGMRAYTIGVTEVAGGGGHILPGDRVDVVLTLDVTGGPGGGGHRWASDIVIQNVRVLGMDLNADPNSTKAAVAHTATLEVSALDSERLALAGQAGALSLALRRAGAAEVERVRPMVTSDLGPAGAGPPRAVAIHRTRPRQGAGASAPASGGAVLVVHGENSASVSVPSERFVAGV